MKELVDSFSRGEIQKAREIHYSLLKLFSMVFIETNPIPVKAILNWMGYCTNELRLPLTALSEGGGREELKSLVKTMRENGFE